MPYANKKGAEQPAHPRSLISVFVVRCLNSIIPLIYISEISSLYLASVAEQAGLRLPWPQTPKIGFLATRLIFSIYPTGKEGQEAEAAPETETEKETDQETEKTEKKNTETDLTAEVAVAQEVGRDGEVGVETDIKTGGIETERGRDIKIKTQIGKTEGIKAGRNCLWSLW